MKTWVSFLLAMIVMVSSVVPCCTADECREDIAAHSTPERPFEDACACSPFFACAFCSGFSYLTVDIQVPEPEAKQLAHYEKIVNIYPSVYCSGLFQPPRPAQSI